MKIIAMLALFSSMVFADDLFLKTGRVFRNIEVLGRRDSLIYIRSGTGVRGFHIIHIHRIEWNKYDPSRSYKLEHFDIDSVAVQSINLTDFRVYSYGEQLSLTKETPPYTYPKIHMLPIGVGFLALSLDAFISVGDLSKQIDSNEQLISQFRQMNLDTQALEDQKSSLESQKTRRLIIGISCIIAGGITTVLAFEKLEVKGNGDSLTLSFQL